MSPIKVECECAELIKNKISSMLENFENEKLKISSIVVGTVIYFAYLKQYLYYKNFNIDIADYIGIEEVLTPFIDDLSIWLPLILFYFVIIFIAVKLLNIYNIQINDKKEISKTNTNIILKILDFIFPQTIYIFIFGFSICVAYLCYKSELYSAKTAVFPLILMCIIEWIFEHNFPIFNNLSDKNKLNIRAVLLFTVISFVSLSISVLNNTTDKFKNEFREKKYVFNFSDNTQIKTDSNTIYLGKTKKYIFFYNKNILHGSGKVEIYNTSSIIKEEIYNLNKLPWILN